MTDMAQTYFRKQIFFPQDHGSWVFILCPLFVGLFAGGRFTPASLSLVIAALAVFLFRQPVTMAVKAYSGRRPKTDLPAARFWIASYGILMLIALLGLIRSGFGYLLLLAIPGAPVFAWHLWLVSKREERRQVNVELIATGVLSLAAPAAYWIGIGHYDPTGWWLWILVWFQTAASIVYAYLRLEQRERAQVPTRSEMWKMGWRSFAYTTFNLVAALVLGLAAVLPRLVFIPYLIQWSETLWGIFHPAIQWKPTRIGIRQLIVSIVWTITLIVTWRL
ncbi:MAG TPA: YwiC-like family protein [Anaerolineales bacterium]|nr:YwiC-like family protein [Anaerolineales bacterium]